MKTLYIDCTAGISGDMLLQALTEIADGEISVPPIKNTHHHEHSHDHDHEHEHDHHGRSYEEVKNIINNMTGDGLTEEARDFALNIYAVIAKAEAAVHGMTLETVHFHEVGRDKAIQNAAGIGAALDRLGFSPETGNTGAGGIGASGMRAGRILVSPIYDGTGFVDCAHGRIPVPVPAVKAMMDECSYDFRTAEGVDTEMVTPSGLASIIGIGAQPAEKGFTIMGSIIAETEAKGTRDTGRGGLRVYLIEEK